MNTTGNNTRALSLLRRAIAYKTGNSWRAVPHVAYIYEPDITDFLSEFEAYKTERGRSVPEAPKITLNTVILKAVAEGLVAAPELNAEFRYHRLSGTGELRLLGDVDIAIPFLLPDGTMIPPVLHAIDKKSIEYIAEEMLDLRRRVDNTDIDELMLQASLTELGRLSRNFRFLTVFAKVFASLFGKNRAAPKTGRRRREYYRIPISDRLSGKDIDTAGTVFTNIGSLYREGRGYVALIDILSPNVFAMGIGSVQEKPGMAMGENGEKEVLIRKFLPFCLCFDHRAVDFAELVPFMRRLDQIFADPGIFFRS